MKFKQLVSLLFLLCNFSLGHAAKNERAHLIVQSTGGEQFNSVRCAHNFKNCQITVSEQFCPMTQGQIKITNNSKIPAYNIKVITVLNQVVINNGCPATLSSGQSCTISFYAQKTPLLIQNVVVKGDNTNSTSFNLNAVHCNVAYITDFNNQTINKCNLNTNGTAMSCSSVTNTSAPYGLQSFMPIGNSLYTYINTVDGTHSYYCSVSLNTGSLLCNLVAPQAIPFTSLFGVSGIVSGNSRYIYLTDLFNGIYQCAVSAATGALSCLTPIKSISSEAPYFNQPSDVAFATASTSGLSYAYVTNIDYEYAGIYQCRLKTNGVIDNSSCTINPFTDPAFVDLLDFKVPFFITTAVVGTNKYAYIVTSQESAPKYIAVCRIDNNGALVSPCATTPSESSIVNNWSPAKVSFTRINGSLYAYIPSSTENLVYRCAVNNEGLFQSCIIVTGITPQSISIAFPVS